MAKQNQNLNLRGQFSQIDEEIGTTDDFPEPSILPLKKKGNQKVQIT